MWKFYSFHKITKLSHCVVSAGMQTLVLLPPSIDVIILCHSCNVLYACVYNKSF